MSLAPVAVEQPITLRSATRSEPICALRSPHVFRGVRWLAMISRHRSISFCVALDDLDRRDAQALLEDLGGVGGEDADRLAADLGQVADVGDEAEQLALVEDRADHAVLGDVRAAAVGIVVQDDVAGLERSRRRAPRPSSGR